MVIKILKKKEVEIKEILKRISI